MGRAKSMSIGFNIFEFEGNQLCTVLRYFVFLNVLSGFRRNGKNIWRLSCLLHQSRRDFMQFLISQFLSGEIFLLYGYGLVSHIFESPNNLSPSPLIINGITSLFSVL